MKTTEVIRVVWSFLAGKKTYLIALAAAAYGIGIQQNLWQHKIWLDLLFGATATATVRHGISAAAQGPAAIVDAISSPNKLSSPKDSGN